MSPLLLAGAALGGASMYLLDREHRRGALDRALVERVRSKMNHYVAHPGAVEVRATGGRIILDGPILAHERPDLIYALQAMNGVSAVVDRLSVFETARGISELQNTQNDKTDAALPRAWSRGTQVAAGTALSLYLVRKSTSAAALLLLAASVAALVRRKPERDTHPVATVRGKPAEAQGNALPLAPEEVF